MQLAEKQIAQLEKIVGATEKQQRLLIRRQLDRATQLASEKPAEAAAIRQSVVTLFGDKVWAADLVDQARAAGNTAGP